MSDTKLVKADQLKTGDVVVTELTSYFVARIQFTGSRVMVITQKGVPVDLRPYDEVLIRARPKR